MRRFTLYVETPKGLRRRDGVETLWERVERLREYIESTRFALTLDDVVHDYQSGKHRYAPPYKTFHPNEEA
jgi:hypothetical protein